MRRNIASQVVAAQMNSRSDGSPLTTGVTLVYTGDGGTQTASGGTLTHEGNGHWSYVPAVGETNFAHVAFTFIHSTGVNVTVEREPVSYDPATIFSGITSLAQWLGLLAGKQTGNATARTELRATGAGSGTFDETTDSQEATRDTAPLGTAMRGTDNAALASVCTETRLAELDAANLPTDVAGVKSDTAAILLDTGTDGVVVASGSKTGYSLAADQSGVTVGTVNALGTQAKADVNAEVDTALADVNLDHLVKVAKDTDWATTVTKESIIDLMTSKNTLQTFDRLSDSLEAVRDRGDEAWLTGASGAADKAYVHVASTGIVIGNVDGGTIADIDVAEGTAWIIGEIAGAITYPETGGGQGIRVEISFAAGVGELPVSLNVWARYAGGAGHSINVYMYDYVGVGWELVGSIPNGAAIQNYSFPTHINHINGSGQMQVMFHHNDGTGVAAHALHLDKVEVENQTVVVAPTVSDIAAVILATPANLLATDASGKVVASSVDALGTQAKADVNAEVDSALNTAIPGSPTADSINERVAAIDGKLPAGNIADATELAATDAVVDSIYGKVSNLSITNRLQITLPAQVVRASSGNKYIKVDMFLTDVDGNMFDSRDSDGGTYSENAHYKLGDRVRPVVGENADLDFFEMTMYNGTDGGATKPVWANFQATNDVATDGNGNEWTNRGTTVGVTDRHNGFGIEAVDDSGVNWVCYSDDQGTALLTVNQCHHHGTAALPQVVSRIATGTYEFWINVDDAEAARNIHFYFGWFDLARWETAYTTASHRRQLAQMQIQESTTLSESSIAAAILVTPANKIPVDGSGNVQIDKTAGSVID